MFPLNPLYHRELKRKAVTLTGLGLIKEIQECVKLHVINCIKKYTRKD